MDGNRSVIDASQFEIEFQFQFGFPGMTCSSLFPNKLEQKMQFQLIWFPLSLGSGLFENELEHFVLETQTETEAQSQTERTETQNRKYVKKNSVNNINVFPLTHLLPVGFSILKKLNLIVAISAARNGVNDYLNFQWAPRHPRDERFPNIRGVLFPAGEVDVSLVLIRVTYHCCTCPFEPPHIRCINFLSL